MGYDEHGEVRRPEQRRADGAVPMEVLRDVVTAAVRDALAEHDRNVFGLDITDVQAVEAFRRDFLLSQAMTREISTKLALLFWWSLKIAAGAVVAVIAMHGSDLKGWLGR